MKLSAHCGDNNEMNLHKTFTWIVIVLTQIAVCRHNIHIPQSSMFRLRSSEKKPTVQDIKKNNFTVLLLSDRNDCNIVFSIGDVHKFEKYSRCER